MQIKKFEALKMSDALRAIKEEMGPDAVILSTREIRKKEGRFGVLDTPIIEVTAAVDSRVETAPALSSRAPAHAGLFQNLLKEMVLTGKLSQEFAPIQEELKAIRETLGTIQAISSENEKQFFRLQKSYDEMKQMLRKGIIPYYRSELASGAPALIPIFDALIASAMDPQVVEELIETLRREIPTTPPIHVALIYNRFREILQGHVRLSDPLTAAQEGTRIIALVGPHGVGKTTTLVKLASHCIQQGMRVVLTTFDPVPEKATGSLGHLAKQIGREVEPLSTLGDFETMPGSKQGGAIVLVDTAGRRNAEQIAELQGLARLGLPVETHLVLAANSGESEMMEVMDRFSVIQIDRLLFTKIEETQHYGLLYTVMHKKEKPISYFAEGAQVSDRLEAASREKFSSWLIPPPPADRPLSVKPEPAALPTQRDVLPGPCEKGSRNQPKVLSVTSGKGGVGKTNVVANLAVALSNMGQRVVVLDADLALGNIDVLFGIVPKYTLEDVMKGERTLAEIMVKGPGGIQILPTGSGASDLANITSEQKLALLSALDQLEDEIDLFLIDTGAGISSNVLFFSTAAQEILIVATPEPTSLTDAYAVMKVLSKQHGEKQFRLLVNMARSDAEAREVYRKLSLVSEQFLEISIDYIGSIPHDDYVKMAVCQQRAVVEIYPKSKSSLEFIRLAKNILQWPVNTTPKGNIQFLWRRLLAPEPVAPRLSGKRDAVGG